METIVVDRRGNEDEQTEQMMEIEAGGRRSEKRLILIESVSYLEMRETSQDLPLVKQPKRLPRALRNAHAERVQRYYQAGTSFGMSVVECCYILASELERGDNDLLWCVTVNAFKEGLPG
jgi:cell division control protein 45